MKRLNIHDTLPHFRVLEVQAETLIFVKGTLSRDGHVLEGLYIKYFFTFCTEFLLINDNSGLSAIGSVS
jgi:hypothetical protein